MLTTFPVSAVNEYDLYDAPAVAAEISADAAANPVVGKNARLAIGLA